MQLEGAVEDVGYPGYYVLFFWLQVVSFTFVYFRRIESSGVGPVGVCGCSFLLDPALASLEAVMNGLTVGRLQP